MSEGRPIRVMVADDHAVVRSGIVGIINAQQDMRVVADVGDGQAAVERYAVLAPDVSLIDLEMPILNGVEVIAAICVTTASAKCIMLTTFYTDDDIERALKVGAKAYLLKDVTPADLVQCIREVHVGRIWMAPKVAEKLANRLTRVQLTTRELDILKLIAKGQANKEIGRELHIAESTVKLHINSLFEKLAVTSRTEAMRAGLERGLIRLR